MDSPSLERCPRRGDRPGRVPAVQAALTVPLCDPSRSEKPARRGWGGRRRWGTRSAPVGGGPFSGHRGICLGPRAPQVRAELSGAWAGEGGLPAFARTQGQGVLGEPGFGPGGQAGGCGRAAANLTGSRAGSPRPAR